MPDHFSNEDILSMLEEMISGRNEFFSPSMIRNIPFQFRNGIMMRYMNTESLYLDLMNRIYTSNLRDRIAATTLLTFRNVSDLIPSFMDPVPVVPTATQISSSVQDCDATQTACAVCQEIISSDACRIRQCGHFYHRTCIVNWLSMSVRCPVCRFDIRQADPSIQTSSASEQMPSQSATQ